MVAHAIIATLERIFALLIATKWMCVYLFRFGFENQIAVGFVIALSSFCVWEQMRRMAYGKKNIYIDCGQEWRWWSGAATQKRGIDMTRREVAAKNGAAKNREWNKCNNNKLLSLSPLLILHSVRSMFHFILFSVFIRSVGSLRSLFALCLPV